MELVIFPVSARQSGIKDMLELKTFWGELYGRLHELV